MGPAELLRYVADVLDRLGIPYRVTGSMATIAYGEPRFTNDIALVVRLRADVTRRCRLRADRDHLVGSRRIAVGDAQAAVARERDVDRAVEVELIGTGRRGVAARRDREHEEGDALHGAFGSPMRRTTRL